MEYRTIVVPFDLIERWAQCAAEHSGTEVENCAMAIWVEIDPDDCSIVEAVVEVEAGKGDRGPALEFTPCRIEKA